MTAMSFARGGADPREVEALRREIDRIVPHANAAMEENHWQLGTRDRRAFPPGHEAMIDARRLYVSSDGSQIIWLIRGGNLINQSGYPANLRDYDVNALLRAKWALDELVDYSKNNTTPHRPTRPTPPPPPRHRGLWERLCDWLGV